MFRTSGQNSEGLWNSTVKLPNAEKAVIAEDKICEYLLNPEHTRGGSKARLLLAMGYTIADWLRLESDIRTYHVRADVDRQTDTGYGMRYEIVAPIVGPTGRAITFRSVWQIDVGTDYPRLITMYPG